MRALVAVMYIIRSVDTKTKDVYDIIHDAFPNRLMREEAVTRRV